jgi:hypothetical protein
MRPNSSPATHLARQLLLILGFGLFLFFSYRAINQVSDKRVAAGEKHQWPTETSEMATGHYYQPTWSDTVLPVTTQAIADSRTSHKESPPAEESIPLKGIDKAQPISKNYLAKKPTTIKNPADI